MENDHRPFLAALLVSALTYFVHAQEPVPLPTVEGVERQPLVAQVKRLVDALDFLGVPFAEADQRALDEAVEDTDAGAVATAIQKVLDPHCLLGVELTSDAELSIAPGAAPKQLVEQGWTQFLIKVHNPTGLTGQLRPAPARCIERF